MVNYQFFPRSHGITEEMQQIVDCFKIVDSDKQDGVQIKSNEMLSLLRPHLEKFGFRVEKGKAKEEKLMFLYCLVKIIL